MSSADENLDDPITVWLYFCLLPAVLICLLMALGAGGVL